MKELVEILDAIDKFAGEGQEMALATIVGVRGSTYRRAGARLLLTRSQQMVGNISGGCLESDVMVVADEVMTSRTPRLATYDLTADDDAVWGLGLGCNGAIDVFVEPVDPASGFFALLRDAITQEWTLGLATALDGPSAGARIVVRADGSHSGTLGDAAADSRAVRAVQAVLVEGTSRQQTLATPSGETRVFIEVLRPPIRLVVCGAGHDAIPVVQQAASLGWRTVVVDQRQRFLTPERFPGAQRFIQADPETATGQVPIDDRTYVVIMTHNYLHDRALLRGFLATEAGYIGMLGPRNRTEKIIAELEAEGVRFSDRDRGRIYGPIGLDVGSETPEEIALAVCGEILAADTARAGGFLRGRLGPIHATRS
ncbi:MAG TPA: XdhC/CoxI family protein [bacterium]|jgi:xanthine/CO dehydrogenase XdhC/CoxF family maturation factor|nr:XdhC/CoxI family protein [bacterium]